VTAPIPRSPFTNSTLANSRRNASGR